MKKNLKIIAIISTALLVIVGIYLMIKNMAEDKIAIKTKEGTIMINNIYENPDREPLADNSVIFKETENYSFYYYPQDEWFSITLLSPNLENARQDAEKNFLKALNIDENDACKLNVYLGTIYEISPEISGINLGLSFCDNGIEIEQTKIEK